MAVLGRSQELRALRRRRGKGQEQIKEAPPTSISNHWRAQVHAFQVDTYSQTIGIDRL